MTAAVPNNIMNSEDSLTGYAVVAKQKVAWGDMDAFQHVNNVQYYRYVESARIFYLDQLKVFLQNFNSVVFSSSCRFMSPVFYPDTLLIGMSITEVRTSGFRMIYDLYSTDQKKLVAKADAIVVLTDQAGDKTSIPDAIKQQIYSLEKDSQYGVKPDA